MNQCVLVFIPGDESCLGLWHANGSADARWCTAVIPRGDRTQSSTNRVLTAVAALLHDNHLILDQITHIGVMRGPASYTELRLFVTTANTLAWAQHLPLFRFEATDALPNDLPHLITTAKVNQPIEPVYPPLQGA